MRWVNLEPIIQSEVSQKEKNKYCTLTHIYGIQKDGAYEPICRAAICRNTDIENRFTDKGGGEEGEGEMSGESNTDAYTLTYVKQRASGNLLYDSGNSSWGSVTT